PAAAPELDAVPEVAESLVDAAAGLSLEAQGALVFAGAVASLLTMFLSALVLRVWSGASWGDLGLSAAKVGQDLRLGLAAFVMLAPPVYAVQLVLVQWFESKHPLIELLKKQPSAGFFLLSGFAAVLVAPVVEEYLFRLLLQGWLERVAGRPAATDRGPVKEPDPTPMVPPVPWGLRPDHDAGPTLPVEGPPPASQPAWWPILVSSTVFSLLHFSHGPDWVPLFLLALGLGYLYWRTHRLLPAITVHFLLNSLSMLALAAEVYGGG
ncbi:MAG: CPBP family intramembrane metalloprotease, partial [Pirellulaceae bacterium]|nr:CPBP family intramembrane metalloprotease [Pirellulaceae bacterium]